MLKKVEKGEFSVRTRPFCICGLSTTLSTTIQQSQSNCVLPNALSNVSRVVRDRLNFLAMIKAATKSIKHFITAAVLLLLMLLLAEVFLRASGNDTAPTITSRTCALHHSVLVPSSTTHHEMQRLAETEIIPGVPFSTNSLGLRGPQPTVSRQPGKTRVLILGDETILGAHLKQDETVTGRLSQFAAHSGQNLEVINAGVPGFCPVLSWLQFEHELRKLRPDVVVLHFDMTDVSDDAEYRNLIRSGESQQICCHTLLSRNRRASNPFVRMICDSSVCNWFRSKTGMLADSDSQGTNQLQRQFEWTESSRSDLRLPIKHAMHPIQLFSEAATEQGFQLLVSTSPVPWQTNEANDFPKLAKKIAVSSKWPVMDDLPHRVLSSMCGKLGVVFCDPTPAFRKFSQPSKLFLADDYRLSNYGTALYAREIAATLLSSQFAMSPNVGKSVH